MPRTLIEIDRSSAEPLYRQVRRAIEHGIASGVFDIHHRLPSSRELAIDLAVSRNTINLAYQELVAEGYVRSHERSGMFVNPEMLDAAASETRATVPRIDWTTRIRRQPDAGIPEIEKTSDWSRYPYPFLAGQVDSRSFPARAWVRCLRDALYQPHANASLQDSVAADDPMLIDMIRQQLLPPRGIEAEPDEVLITVGRNRASIWFPDCCSVPATGSPWRTRATSMPGTSSSARAQRCSGSTSTRTECARRTPLQAPS